MLKIAICDDMNDILQNTKSILEAWDESDFPYHIETFDNGDDLIRAHKAAPFDIIILDIVMPLLNGIDTAKEIREFDKAAKIIFLTSAPEFAVASYSVKATNYLLKPVVPEELYSCLREIFAELHNSSKNIAIRCYTTVYRVELQSIEYIEAQNKAVEFYLSDGRCLHSIQPLYSYENQLDLADGFFRCHRSYMVNLQRIDSYTQKEIRMRSGARIPISRKYQKDFEIAYFETLFGKAGD